MIILSPAELRVGGLYEYCGDLSGINTRANELALYDEINEHFLHPYDVVLLGVFLLLERQERGFPYHGRYWLKILTNTGVVGWILSNLDYQFEELTDVCMGT